MGSVPGGDPKPENSAPFPCRSPPRPANASLSGAKFASRVSDQSEDDTGDDGVVHTKS